MIIVWQISLGYEILAGPADAVRWIRCVGRFSIDKLAGAESIS